MPELPSHLDPPTPRQLGLLALVRSLEGEQTHHLKIHSRGKDPWNIAVEHAEVSFGQEAPVGGVSVENPLDVWDLVLKCAREDRLPEKEDAQRLKAYGLYARPAEGGFMLRTRIPGCVLRSEQLRALADICKTYGSGELMLTMRGNVQIRGIKASKCVEAIMALQDCGLTSIGAGANNVRNIMASPTSGLDPEEILDVRPHARELHHYILHHPELYGLPHKFNLAFDNGVRPGVFVDKNDLGFIASRMDETSGFPSGIYFEIHAGAKVSRGLPSSHSGFLVRERDVVPYAAGIILLYKYRSQNIGRKRIRLRDVLDKQGLQKFLMDAAILSDVELLQLEEPPPRPDQHLHHSLSGAHPQKQPGYTMLGVTAPVGRLSEQQLRDLADLTEDKAAAEIRLTFWQNMILPHVPSDRVAEVQEQLEEMGLSARDQDPGSSVVACTGIGACPFAATDAKDMGLRMTRLLREEMSLPLNLNINSCTNACAHHTFGEIGLLGVKDREGNPAYHLFLGKDRPDEEISRPVLRSIPEDEVEQRIRNLLRAFNKRRGESENFATFVHRMGHDPIEAMIRES